jgi:hypothetical protein
VGLRIFRGNNIPALDLLLVERINAPARPARHQPKLAVKLVQNQGIKFPREEGMNFGRNETYGRFAKRVGENFLWVIL